MRFTGGGAVGPRPLGVLWPLDESPVRRTNGPLKNTNTRIKKKPCRSPFKMIKLNIFTYEMDRPLLITVLLTDRQLHLILPLPLAEEKPFSLVDDH